MTIAGNIYGVVLNDSAERAQLAGQFEEKPYAAPPVAPVLYMKPLASIAHGPIGVPADTSLVAAATLALLFARDAARVDEQGVAACLGAVALALDLSIPATSYYRPAIAQKNGDGRLALGDFVAPRQPARIRLFADGELLHEWPLDRLVRPLETLVADLGAFLTLKAGDVLLVGLPGDAPRIRPGQALRVEADGFPPLEVATKGDGV